MGQRELLLVLGALTLFGVTMLSTNRYVAHQNDSLFQLEFEYYAVSLAQSFIEEAKTKAFDANFVNTAIQVPDDYTDPDSLGVNAVPDSLGIGPVEIYPNFSDIDDYNGFAVIDSTSRGEFTINIQVGYVTDTDPDVVVGVRTFYKKMTVTVSNDYLLSPVQVSYVFGNITLNENIEDPSDANDGTEEPGFVE